MGRHVILRKETGLGDGWPLPGLTGGHLVPCGAASFRSAVDAFGTKGDGGLDSSKPPLCLTIVLVIER